MSALDIIIISIGVLAVLAYGFFEIRKTLKFKKRVKELIAKGLKPTEAKEIAENELYSKKRKEKSKGVKNDKTFDE